MAAWEVFLSAFVAMIALFFFIGFSISDDKRYMPFKILLIWLGFTLIIPLLWCFKKVTILHITAVGNMFNTLLMLYLPIYTGIVYIVYIVFLKDVWKFLKSSIEDIKESKKEQEYETI